MITFLTLLNLALLAHLISVFRRGGLLKRGLHLLSGLVVAATFATLVREDLSLAPVNPLAVGFSLFGVLSLGLGLGGLLRNPPYATRRAANVQASVHALLLVAGVYFAGVSVDHLLFFRGERAGVVNVRAFGVADIPCDTAFVRLDENRYRCAELAFQNHFSQPFAPWPGYTAGRSETLRATYEEAIRNSEMLP